MFPGADGRASRYLLPLLDLINHDGASPAVRIEQAVAAGVFQATALRDITAGEEVTHRCVASGMYCMLTSGLTPGQVTLQPPRFVVAIGAHI